MGDRPFGDEAHELIADLAGAVSADADVELLRQQRRLRGEPSMSRKEAGWRANQHLCAEKLTYVADSPSALPNGAQDLCIVSYHDPAAPEVVLTGGGLVVTTTGEVRDLLAAPEQPEMIGVTYPHDDEEA